MPDDMGSFRVDVEIENPARPGEKRTLRSVLVDTGAELSWVPKSVLESLGVERNSKWYFRQADGTVLERWTGIVVISIAGKRTGDDVVFGEPGDLVLLGSRTLEGLNVRIEPVTKRLVDAGPAPWWTRAPRQPRRRRRDYGAGSVRRGHVRVFPAGVPIHQLNEGRAEPGRVLAPLAVEREERPPPAAPHFRDAPGTRLTDPMPVHSHPFCPAPLPRHDLERIVDALLPWGRRSERQIRHFPVGSHDDLQSAPGRV